MVPAQTCTGKAPSMSALGHKQTCAARKGNVRFTLNSDRESRHPQPVMSALPPKADMCSALADVCFGPKADIVRVDVRQLQCLVEQWLLTVRRQSLVLPILKA